MLLALTGCGDDAPAQVDSGECAQATRYMGPAITCDEGRGLCVESHGAVMCKPQCADNGPACTDAFWMTILIKDGTSACYCDRP